jgi:hypothetical protein
MRNLAIFFRQPFFISFHPLPLCHGVHPKWAEINSLLEIAGRGRPRSFHQASSSRMQMKVKKPKGKKVVIIDNGIHSSKVWINPNSTFKGPRSIRGWGQGQLSPPTAARFLELADVALGSVQPPTRRKKLTA